jgi:hypothetical protein
MGLSCAFTPEVNQKNKTKVKYVFSLFLILINKIKVITFHHLLLNQLGTASI